MSELPIERWLPEIVAAAATGAAVVQAAPGAGKTTRVPSALLDADLGGGRDVVVLEPRRIAARAAAEFVAQQRGSQVGGEVGYRVRFEQRGSAHTRLWFVSEGNFTRQLASDPFLERVGVVVLDEFHERHLQADFALAALLSLRRSVRPDLKLVVMSATLESERVAAHVGGELVRSEGRTYPVAVEYLGGEPAASLPHRIAAALRELDCDGDVLVFLPGAREIRRTRDEIGGWTSERGIEIVPLHGDLPLAEQYRAIHAGPRRKVILSTNVAETALTVEGVTVVIDSGLARRVRFDARHGINHIAVARISRAAADQRAGRAGRLAPGRCLRLWSRADHDGRLAHEIPEIRRLDLSDLLLELRAWGLAAPEDLDWLDPPKPTSWKQAERLLALLGAMDEGTGSLTEIGRQLLRLSLPPRLARMLVEARAQHCEARGRLLAALACERDIFLDSRTQLSGGNRALRDTSHSSDLLLRMDLFEEAQQMGLGSAACRALGLDTGAVRAVERTHRSLGRVSSVPGVAKQAKADLTEEQRLRRCVLAAFPDRVVRRRAPESARGLMVGNKGVVLAPSSAVRSAEYFVAVELEAGERTQGSEARVRTASAIEHEWLEETFPDAIKTVTQVVFDPQREAVITRRATQFWDLTLEEAIGASPEGPESARALAAAVRADPERYLQPSEAARALLARLAAAARFLPELGLPQVNDLLLGAVDQLCVGRRSCAELRHADLAAALRQQLTGQQWTMIERELPRELELPNGRRTPVRYEPDRPPLIAARIQELFGLTATPRLARGRVAVVIELLAPNQRPVQVTDDLASFWGSTYKEVRKQLRGRYPRHAWPEDPWSLPPQRGVRRR